MMFVFGEVADPLQEATLLVEDIVRSQVIEIVGVIFYIHSQHSLIRMAHRLFRQQLKLVEETHDTSVLKT